MVDHRLERSDQPDVLCDLRVRARLRLPEAEGGEADARRASQGQGRGGQRYPRGDGTQRRGAARVRPVGHRPSGYVGVEMFRSMKGGGASVRLSAGEATLLRTLVVPVMELLNDPDRPAPPPESTAPRDEATDLFDDLEKMFNE